MRYFRAVLPACQTLLWLPDLPGFLALRPGPSDDVPPPPHEPHAGLSFRTPALSCLPAASPPVLDMRLQTVSEAWAPTQLERQYQDFAREEEDPLAMEDMATFMDWLEDQNPQVGVGYESDGWGCDG